MPNSRGYERCLFLGKQAGCVFFCLLMSGKTEQSHNQCSDIIRVNGLCEISCLFCDVVPMKCRAPQERDAKALAFFSFSMI